MTVLVDTSVWVDFINGHPSREVTSLEALIEQGEEIATCGLIVAEVFQGLRRNETRRKLEREFRNLFYLHPTGFDTYLRAAELFRDLRQRGITIRSTVDCVLVVIAEETRACILAKDRDVTQILASGLTSVLAWPS